MTATSEKANLTFLPDSNHLRSGLKFSVQNHTVGESRGWKLSSKFQARLRRAEFTGRYVSDELAGATYTLSVKSNAYAVATSTAADELNPEPIGTPPRNPQVCSPQSMAGLPKHYGYSSYIITPVTRGSRFRIVEIKLTRLSEILGKH